MNMYRLALYLAERGHSITFIAARGTSVRSYAEKAGLTVEHLTVKVKYFDIGAAYRLSAILKKRNVSSLLFSIAKDNYVAGWAKRFFYPSLQLFYWQQMQTGIPKKGPVQTLMYRALTGWIAPLPWLAVQAQKMTNMPPERIYVIVQGVNVPVFIGARTQREEARRHFGLPDDGFVVGVVGRIDPMKGQEYLIKAAARARRAGKPLHALIIGEAVPAYLQHLKELIAELEVARFVHIHPYTDDPSLAYAALDVFAMASLNETYGMVTVEAMVAGLAVVGFNSGGTPELLGNGQYGILIPPEDDEALTAALLRLMDTPEERQALGRVAQTYAAGTFTMALQCTALENLLQGVPMTPTGPSR
jgi:glycosyltransferase involved in cell wall biosynthesis